MRKGFAAEVCKVISGSGSLNCVKFILSKSCKVLFECDHKTVCQEIFTANKFYGFHGLKGFVKLFISK